MADIRQADEGISLAAALLMFIILCLHVGIAAVG